MAHNIFLFFCLISLAAAIEVSYAVTYTVTNTAANTPGGSRFSTDIGDAYTLQIMASATNFIWTTFKESDPSDRKGTQQVSVYIDVFSDNKFAYTENNMIHLSANYIKGYNGDVKREITGVLYHEMTRVWQWNGNGNGNENEGLLSGIADYIRLKAGYAPSNWVKPGGGDHWDQGYDVTALFLNYCDGLHNGFVADLNKKMRNDYADSYFFDLLGKTVDDLWDDYTDHYNGV